MPTSSHRLARWGGSALLVAAMLVSGPAGARAGTAPAAIAHAGVAAPSLDSVLWDQTTTTIPPEEQPSYTSSSKFEPPLSHIDNQAADDFDNADGVPWEITAVRVIGIYEGGTGTSQLNALLVQVYADNSGLPGVMLISQTVSSGQITGLATGEFTVNLSPSLIVGPGRYWLSAQAYKPDFLATGRQWLWQEKVELVLAGSAWRQPGNSYGKNCINFLPRVDVCDQPTGTDRYDLLFAVFGNSALDTSVPNPVPIATSLVPGSKAPGGPSFTLAVVGVNFVSTSKVVWGASELTPSAWSGTRLTVTVPSGYIATAGDVPVKVRNPAPGGGDSNALNFHIGSRLFLPFIRKP